MTWLASAVVTRRSNLEMEGPFGLFVVIVFDVTIRRPLLDPIGAPLHDQAVLGCSTPHDTVPLPMHGFRRCHLQTV